MANQEEPLYLNNDVIEQILIHSWVINSGVICEKTFVAEVDSQSREIWIPRDLGNDGHFGGSCNGLLCTEVKGEITVFNPITREVVYLPKPTFIQGSGLNYEYERMYTDFLFHNATGEYKVILFYQNCIMQLCAVHIYTLGANTSWRQVGNIGIFPSNGGVNVEDTVYWPSCSPGYNGMIFFNLSEENINFIYFPINNRMLLGLTKWHDGKLCDVCFQMEHRRIEFRIHSNSVEGPIAPSYEIQLQYDDDWLLAPYSIKMNRVFFVNSENSLVCRDISGEHGDFSVKYTCFGSICEIKNCFAYVESLLPVPI
ncbi:F-box protein [Carex littledalei]|uniref:F-box protein n=1 Tax=Carex littledalei TaxID=544730 RepID=A0A833QXS2_9POAL|nr:F-box protein [Carex littledalei]